LPVNNLKGDTKKLHDLHLRDQHQVDGLSINEQLKNKKQQQETPKTEVGMKQFEIQPVSVSMLQKIFIKTFNQTRINNT
jgi:hypothetical protein